MSQLLRNYFVALAIMQIAHISQFIVEASVIDRDQYTKEGYYGRFVEVNMCGDYEDDPNSKSFCDCKTEIISCDFTDFEVGDKPTHMHLISAWESDLIKRVCICGAPKNLEILFSNYFLRDHYSVHRVDIYNMKGPITIAAAFDVNFAGDVYMSGISYLREILSWGFGRGSPMELVDVTDLKCCSKITSPKLQSPAFFVENSTIGMVRSSGINPQHNWKSIVFNKVNFLEMDEFAMMLETPEEDLNFLNVAFVNCRLNNLSDNSIAVSGAVNLLIAKSVFHETCANAPIYARTSGNATVAYIGNDFQVPSTCLKVVGENIMVWYNKFKVWSTEATCQMNSTNGTVSIQYNSIDSIRVDSKDIFDKNTIFYENVISSCPQECYTMNVIKNSSNLFTNSTNRCNIFIGSTHCILALDDIMVQECNSESPNLESLCSNDGENFHYEPLKIQPLDSHLQSKFIIEMLKYYANDVFRIPYNKTNETEEVHIVKPSGDDKIILSQIIKKIVLDTFNIIKYYLI